jgi:hypothetical protein
MAGHWPRPSTPLHPHPRAICVGTTVALPHRALQEREVRMYRVVGFSALCFVGRLLVACGASAESEPDAVGTTSEAMRALPNPGDVDTIGTTAPRPTRPPVNPPADPPPAAPAPATGPGHSNLVLDGGLIFTGFDNPDFRSLEIYVTNKGSGPTDKATGYVTFQGFDFPAEMHIEPGGSPIPLPPGQSGFLSIIIRAPAIAQCMTFPVVIDSTHELEGMGRASSVYGDNSGSPATQCLTWTAPLSADMIEKPTINSLLYGKSLDEIVNSEEQGSQLGKCNACHNGTVDDHYDLTLPDPDNVGQTYHISGTYKYRPSNTSGITSTSNISGWSWAGPGGWAHAFGTTTAIKKPADLREAFLRWENNGSPSGGNSSQSGFLDQPPTMMGQ